MKLRFPTPLANKVPEITFAFWITKILSTGMGEDTSDFFVHKIGPNVSVILGLLVLLVSLYFQFQTQSYRPWIYWSAVVMVSVFGTMAADVVHIGLGVPYLYSTIFFFLVLCAIFYVWNKVEGTLSIDSINTQRREIFYWATILATFALGTAAGDMTARTLNWGFLLSGILFGIAFFIPGLAFLAVRKQAILAFWLSYIITRPFGASFADWFGADKAKGGLGYGFGTVSIILTLAIVGMLAGRRLEK